MKAAVLAAALTFAGPAAAIDALEYAKEYHRLRDFQWTCTAGQLPDGELAEAREIATACAEVAILVRALRTEGFCTTPANAEALSSIGWVKCPDPEVPYEHALAAFRRGDYAEAIEPLRQFAGQNHVGAQYHLGVAYANGEGLPQDNKKAVMWFRKAAEKGFPEAQDYLGFMYEKGFGLPKDFAHAVTWYRRAGEQGLLNAQNKLGEMYAEGRGVPTDKAEALKWYRKAAEQGDAQARSAVDLLLAKDNAAPEPVSPNAPVEWVHPNAKDDELSRSLATPLPEDNGFYLGPAGRQPARAPTPDVALAVGQKAIFYEERTTASEGSAEPGSIVWSLIEDSPGGSYLQPEPAIRAEATIPGKDVKLRMTIKRNADKTLPASHIIEMIFLTPESFAGGGIDNILRVAMKGSEQEAGDPLIGIPAKIADGFFLFALSDTKTEVDANLTLLRRQKWIDVPIVYKSGRRALLTMEKGILGDMVFDDALKVWGAANAGPAPAVIATPSIRPPVFVAGRRVGFQIIPGDTREIGWIYVNVCSSNPAKAAENLRQGIQDQQLSSMRLIVAKVAYFQPSAWECVHLPNSLVAYAHTRMTSGKERTLSTVGELMNFLSKFGITWHGGFGTLSRDDDDNFRFDVWLTSTSDGLSLGAQAALVDEGVPLPTWRPDLPQPAWTVHPSDAEIVKFVRTVLEAHSKDDTLAIRDVIKAYSGTISYFGKTAKLREVVADKRAYFQRWPERHYAIREPSVSVSCASDTCEGRGYIDGSVRSLPRNMQASGAASFRYLVEMNGMRIVLEDSTIVTNN